MIDAGHLAYFLQLFKGIGCVRPELVCFINKYEVIFIGIPIIVVFFVKYFVKAAVRYEFSVLVYAEIFEGAFPVLLHCRRVYDKHFGVVTAILLQEFFRNHCSHDCFSKTDNIREEKSVIT